MICTNGFSVICVKEVENSFFLKGRHSFIAIIWQLKRHFKDTFVLEWLL